MVWSKDFELLNSPGLSDRSEVQGRLPHVSVTQILKSLSSERMEE